MTPQEGVPVADPGNPLINKVPCKLDTGKAQTPIGELGVVTIRTATTTLTVLLDGNELKDWVKILTALSSQTSSNGLIVTGPPIPVTPREQGPAGEPGLSRDRYHGRRRD